MKRRSILFRFEKNNNNNMGTFQQREKHWTCVQWSLDIINVVWFSFRSVFTFPSLPFPNGTIRLFHLTISLSAIDSWRAAKKNYLPFPTKGKRKIFSFVSAHLCPITRADFVYAMLWQIHVKEHKTCTTWTPNTVEMKNKSKPLFKSS